jgi:cytochrome oxidase assembly protein ShyY1
VSSLRRRVGIVAIALVVAAGCAAAGAWQWDRHVTRSAAIATQRANADGDPVPLELLVGPGRPLDPADTWRPAVVVGRYLPTSTVLLRNRPVDGRPAIGVLAVLSITDGSLAGQTLVVHRGWVRPPDDVAEGEPVPEPPDREVELVVRLRPSEIYEAADVPATTLEAYGVLVSEAGGPAPGLHAVPLPDTAFGPHLSYAFQWWFFAAGSLVGAVVLVRRENDDTVGRDETGPQPPRRPHRRTDEEEEDALVDAADRAGSTTAPA